MISGYRIQKEIGSGGMATVYLALQESVDRLVALKVLRPEFSQSLEFADRFLREAKLAASLSHSHLVTIYDFGNDNGTLFLVMEFLQGRTLASLLDAGLSEQDVLRIFRDLAIALAVIHRKGLVHRDIKPENVVFRDEDNTIPVITDFGVARSVDDRFALTTIDVVIGTPKYMSPEQAKSEPVKPCSDLYSFGIMFYQALVGKLPFKGSIIDVESEGDRKAFDLPPQFDVYRPLFNGLLEWDGDRRFQSVEEMLRCWDNLGERELKKKAKRHSSPFSRGQVPFMASFLGFSFLSVLTIWSGQNFGDSNVIAIQQEEQEVVEEVVEEVLEEVLEEVVELEQIIVPSIERVEPDSKVMEFSIVVPPRDALCLTDDPWMMGWKDTAMLEGGRCGAIKIKALKTINVAIVGVSVEGGASLLWPTECDSVVLTTHPSGSVLYYPEAEEKVSSVVPLAFTGLDEIWIFSTEGVSSGEFCSSVLPFIANPGQEKLQSLARAIHVAHVPLRQ